MFPMFASMASALQDSFLSAIHKDPDDVASYMAYADWLADNGQQDRAEYIVLHLEAARGEAGNPARLKELCNKHPEWFPDRQYKPQHKKGVLFDVTLTAAQMSAGEFTALRTSFPELRGLQLKECTSQQLETLLKDKCADFEALHTMNLRDNRIGAAGAAALASASGLAGLHTLGLGYNIIGAAGAASLASASRLAGLHTLNLERNEIGAAGAAFLASASGLAGLCTLDLWGNQIGDEGAKSLASASGLAGLRTLDLAGNRINDERQKQLSSAMPHCNVKFHADPTHYTASTRAEGMYKSPDGGVVVEDVQAGRLKGRLGGLGN